MASRRASSEVKEKRIDWNPTQLTAREKQKDMTVDVLTRYGDLSKDFLEIVTQSQGRGQRFTVNRELVLSKFPMDPEGILSLTMGNKFEGDIFRKAFLTAYHLVRNKSDLIHDPVAQLKVFKECQVAALTEISVIRLGVEKYLEDRTIKQNGTTTYTLESMTDIRNYIVNLIQLPAIDAQMLMIKMSGGKLNSIVRFGSAFDGRNKMKASQFDAIEEKAIGN